MTEPVTELDARYGEEGVSAVPWREAERTLATAELSWLSTVRPDGQPHVTPLITAWHDGALWITTGPEEQKARNLAANPRCTLTTEAHVFEVRPVRAYGFGKEPYSHTRWRF
jgi:hypothetical protein